ncbi:uncharacterized protein B0T15DRAFT_6918 [Chaetomium strumarium]|uniref:Uncharacterized protein n=1 Tax=Chaetomium strumarium TaxID=1170767 RepID=A0AAJ0H167_9PEZI|nr:hypothetical protein B0T15DRAFT_6918 [Chaetomium strumarium]
MTMQQEQEQEQRPQPPLPLLNSIQPDNSRSPTLPPLSLSGPIFAPVRPKQPQLPTPTPHVQFFATTAPVSVSVPVVMMPYAPVFHAEHTTMHWAMPIPANLSSSSPSPPLPVVRGRRFESSAEFSSSVEDGGQGTHEPCLALEEMKGLERGGGNNEKGGGDEERNNKSRDSSTTMSFSSNLLAGEGLRYPVYSRRVQSRSEPVAFASGSGSSSSSGSHSGG